MIRAILGVLTLGMVLTLNQAQAAVAAPSSAFDDFMRTVTGPGKQTISFGSNGTPVVAPGVPSLSSSGGPLQMSRTGSLPLSGGARLPVTATAKISSGAAAVLIGAGIKLAGPLGVLITGYQIYEFVKELGFQVDNGLTVTKSDPTVCTVAPCYLKKLASANYGTYTGNTIAQAAASMQSGYNAQGLDYLIASFSVSGSSVTFIENKRSTGAYYTTRVITASDVPTAPSSPVLLPSTLQELQDAIAAQSGWPSTSAIAQAVVDAQKLTGTKIPTDQPDITGPASVSGPDEVTKSGNKETTKHTDFNCTYDNSAKFGQYGGSVSCSQKTTTTDRITDPNTGGVITVPGDETTQPVEPSPEDGPAIDTALPAQPTLYKRQYPDGLTGVWNAKKAELLATPLLQLTSNLQPTIAAPSGYPTWPVPVVIGRWNFGTYDVSPASYVWDFLKVCTIIGALFLARALIFGG